MDITTGIKMLDMSILILFGACLGSFYNVVGLRLLKGEAPSGRSRCPECNTLLNMLDMIPIFSYLILKGKCKYCQQQISTIYFAGEITMSVTLPLVYMFTANIVDFISYFIVCSMLVIALVSDLKDRIVPNLLVGVSAIAVLLLRLVVWEGVLLYLAGSLFLFLSLAFVAGAGWMGGGDVKILSVMALGGGLWATLASLFLASFLGATIMLPAVIAGKMGKKDEFPFVPFIWGGTILSLVLKTSDKWITIADVFPGVVTIGI